MKNYNGEREENLVNQQKWDIAIEFPEVIATEGRTKLYEIAHYFGLAYHLAGKKGKNRKCLIYPKSMFIEKQNSEKIRR